ncbi:GntR family transcriptional regulator [Kibdelosporangium phytohabitans]|uniref:GntR family transcriptional regulator n=1 Tax=Kibdelosporangium phytohabitans TaxID=860235 RepID=UPI0014707B87|nr:GntR family transcriptional regulator [Kibdelosporangium phytohabitans]MBE1467587.1 DNA-binding transcriptional regulator YhcF (GntR family)/site-specific recombinase XerD [Kibdelosporangium phytohabitans]
MGENKGASGARPSGRGKRERGSIDRLPSGSLRVRVYTGTDPITHREHYITETIKSGPKAWDLAEQKRTEILRQLDLKQHARTNATVSQLMDEYLAQHDVERTTKHRYLGDTRNHIKPLLGIRKVGDVDAEKLEKFYAELRRCRYHCRGRTIRHRSTGEHECDTRCKTRSHTCKPLGRSTVRQMHFLLSGAFAWAVRHKWVGVNPVDVAKPPTPQRPDPDPPEPEELARILNAAWESNPDYFALLWIQATTGPRRGEICARRFSHILKRHSPICTGRDCHEHGCHWRFEVDTAMAQIDGEVWEKDTKTHQSRRPTLDVETIAVILDHEDRLQERAAALGIALSADAYLASLSPDGGTPIKPSTLSQWFRRLVTRLGIDTTLKSLRAYSATELIAAGVDIRTVAGRLGHGGGGATTLRVYSGFVEEADQRAATAIPTRMPARPMAPPRSASERAKTEPRHPYERVAAALRSRILEGVYSPGEFLPTSQQLALEHEVSAGTVNRAFDLLKGWGLVDASRGSRATVIAATDAPKVPPSLADGLGHESTSAAPTLNQVRDPVIDPAHAAATEQPGDNPARDAASHGTNGSIVRNAVVLPAAVGLNLEILHLGHTVRTLRVEADPGDFAMLQKLMRDAIRRMGTSAGAVDDYEMNVSTVVDGELVTTVVMA